MKPLAIIAVLATCTACEMIHPALGTLALIVGVCVLGLMFNR